MGDVCSKVCLPRCPLSAACSVCDHGRGCGDANVTTTVCTTMVCRVVVMGSRRCGHVAEEPCRVVPVPHLDGACCYVKAAGDCPRELTQLVSAVWDARLWCSIRCRSMCHRRDWRRWVQRSTQPRSSRQLRLWRGGCVRPCRTAAVLLSSLWCAAGAGVSWKWLFCP